MTEEEIEKRVDVLMQSMGFITSDAPQDTPCDRLRLVIPHLRAAATEALGKANPDAKAELAIIARNQDGSGQVGAGFELEAFLVDVGQILDHIAALEAEQRARPAAPCDREALGRMVRGIRGEWMMGVALRAEEEEEDRRIGEALHFAGFAEGRADYNAAVRNIEDMRRRFAELTGPPCDMDTLGQELRALLCRNSPTPWGELASELQEEYRTAAAHLRARGAASRQEEVDALRGELTQAEERAAAGDGACLIMMDRHDREQREAHANGRREAEAEIVRDREASGMTLWLKLAPLFPAGTGSPALRMAIDNAAAHLHARGAASRQEEIDALRVQLLDAIQDRDDAQQEAEEAEAEKREMAGHLMTARAEIARLTRELVAARDCGQSDVCATPPGCARHWEERNRELARALAEERAASAQTAQMAANENARLTAEREHLKRREESIIDACERVADGGQYRADIVSAIQRIRRERDEARVQAGKLTAELAAARTQIEQGIVGVAALKEMHAEELTTARADGAREERASLTKSLARAIYQSDNGFGSGDLHELLEGIGGKPFNPDEDDSKPEPMTNEERERWRRHGSRYAMGYTAGEKAEREAIVPLLIQLAERIRARGQAK